MPNRPAQEALLSLHPPAHIGSRTIVTKTLKAGSDGTRRHVRVHGNRLVCVRHRLDPVGACRLVTVEIVVEVQPIQARDNPDVVVRIDPAAKSLRARLLALGARWDTRRQLWSMPRSVALSLRLTRRIVSAGG